MCRNQLNRRNLSTYQKGLLGIVIQDALPKRPGNQYTASASTTGVEEARPYPVHEAAKTVGTSDKTLSEVRYLEEHADEETKEKGAAPA